MTQVFISYSRKDIKFVKRLAGDLKAAGFSIWYDLSGLDGGTTWGTEIQSAIEKSQFFLVVLSPNSTVSKWVQREFLFAEDCNLKVIPLQYLPCRMPMWMLDLQSIDLQGRNYSLNFERLLKALGGPPAPVEPPANAAMGGAGSKPGDPAGGGKTNFTGRTGGQAGGTRRAAGQKGSAGT